MARVEFKKALFSGEIAIAGTFALPLLAHGNKDIEYLLDGYGVNAALDRLFENRFQHTGSPVLVVNGKTERDLDPGDLSRQFLPLCNEPYYLGIHA